MRREGASKVEEAKVKLFGRCLRLSSPAFAMRSRNRAAIRLCLVLAAGLFLGMLLANYRAAADDGRPPSTGAPYVFAVVPQFEQRKLHSIWQPIVDELERRTALHFNLVTTLTVPEFEVAYSQGTFDFVYANPYIVVHFHDTQPYIPLVADRAPMRGILVARADGEIKSAADLNGKTVAFPSPNSFGASLLVRSELEHVHNVQITPLYVKTHSSVYLHVAKGLAAAGGGIEKTLREQDDAIRGQLRIILTTRSCPSLPVAAHPRVPTEIREKIRAAFLDMSGTQRGREILARIPATELIPVTYDSYTVLSSWGLEKYWRAAPPEQNQLP
jgi:phosphonate transport system substrate-binding protein